MAVFEGAEEELKKISKLPENKRCANCENENKFGHGNICMPYRTFVCSDCKSAHQAYSHRVKSVTQSNFTREEVESLRSKNGGGNDQCRRTWLALCPVDDPSRPQKGEHPDKYKRFVTDAYEKRRWYSADSRPAPTPAPAPAPTPPVTALGGAAAQMQVPAALDFAAMNSKGRWGPGTPAATIVTPAAPVLAAAQPVEADFDLLGLSSAPLPSVTDPRAHRPTAAPQPVALASGFDDFISFAPAPAPAAAGFDFPSFTAPIQTPSVAPLGVSSGAGAMPMPVVTGFDFMALSGAPAPAPAPVAPQPLMFRQNTGLGDWSAIGTPSATATPGRSSLPSPGVGLDFGMGMGLTAALSSASTSNGIGQGVGGGAAAISSMFTMGGGGGVGVQQGAYGMGQSIGMAQGMTPQQVQMYQYQMQMQAHAQQRAAFAQQQAYMGMGAMGQQTRPTMGSGAPAPHSTGSEGIDPFFELR